MAIIHVFEIDMIPISQVCCVNSLDFFGDLQSYTFLKTAEYKEPENQCFHLFTFMSLSLQQPFWIIKNNCILMRYCSICIV